MITAAPESCRQTQTYPLAALAEPQPSTHPFLISLRNVLDEGHAHVNLAMAAHQLRTSMRSLQRALAVAGTSFRAELCRVRIAKAQERLRQENVPLTTLALDLGYSSLQSFDRQFRKRTGMPPSRWRKHVHLELADATSRTVRRQRLDPELLLRPEGMAPDRGGFWRADGAGSNGG
jgi:AraC-like DNA-binding protein